MQGQEQILDKGSLPHGAVNRPSLLMSEAASRRKRLAAFLGRSVLFLVTSSSAIAVLLIFLFIILDAFPFFLEYDGSRIAAGKSFGEYIAFAWERLTEFFGGTKWYPSGNPPSFQALAIFAGTAIVTAGATILAVPMGVSAAICLSDVLPFGIRQAVKPVIEILAAIPSVAYGFFALVVFSPLLERQGGTILSVGAWMIGLPLALILSVVAGDLLSNLAGEARRKPLRVFATLVIGAVSLGLLYLIGARLAGIKVSSGANALNASIILGIMALPTVVSVSEDALQAVGREMREGSYALGATRAETMMKVIVPAASSGILAAVILGVMRAVGETMVVWMAAGNAAQIPKPWYNLLAPVRTLTANIAADMGEADHSTGSARYHVLFLMAFCLLIFCFVSNLISEWVVRRARRKLG